MKACSVWYTSLTEAPCFMTFSRSTSAYSCGTLERESARRSNTGDGRRREGEGNPFRQRRQIRIDSLLDGLELLRARFPVVPGLQRHEEEGVVAGAHETEQAEPNNARRMLNTGCVGQNVFDFRS